MSIYIISKMENKINLLSITDGTKFGFQQIKNTKIMNLISSQWKHWSWSWITIIFRGFVVNIVINIVYFKSCMKLVCEALKNEVVCDWLMLISIWLGKYVHNIIGTFSLGDSRCVTISTIVVGMPCNAFVLWQKKFNQKWWHFLIFFTIRYF